MTASTAAVASVPEGGTGEAASLTLLSGFELRSDGRPLAVPLSSQRLLAFLALRDRAVQRSYVAGSLWTDATEERAHANLRSALWRLPRPGAPLVVAQGGRLQIAPWLHVDLRVAIRQARDLVGDACDVEVVDVHDVPLTLDLLPDWYEDWVLVERERYRQLRLHALERMCERLVVCRRYAEAVEIGLAAVVGEPLRESAQRTLIAAYLAEGNPGEAVRQYRGYRALLREELGTEPSAQLAGLIADATR